MSNYSFREHTVSQATKKPLGSVSLDHGVRVGVSPWFIDEHSDPAERRYVFGYRITITNEGDRWAKLLSRRWTIVDATGQREEVGGEGVVGQQPELSPGQSFEYASFCPLPTPWGTMEGIYTMQRDDGTRFDVNIGRFYLVAPNQ